MLRIRWVVLLLAAPLAAEQEITVTIDASRVLNTFDPLQAIGAGIDGHERGEIARMLSQANVRAMLSAGLKPLSYRLRTELAGEAWHWNPEGDWSDPQKKQGYWVSRPDASKPIDVSYGYRLPRRGNTGDQANNDSYSRLDDGDDTSFWKSNPYLDRYFTGQDNPAHLAWVVVDFGHATRVNAVRIAWGEPYATRLSVEYSESPDVDVTQTGIWRTFERGADIGGAPAMQTIRVAPAITRYVRIVMRSFSGTGHGADMRDRLGVAIREIYAGVIDGNGAFTDAIRHRKDQGQTRMYVSSTDPWHRASDRDENVEQPGFDLVFRSGLTRGLPLLTAVPLLYDVPENAANEIRYMRNRNYAVTHAELGEEPEEQWIMPEDYGALYGQWSRALHAVDPELRIGGPSLVMLHSDIVPDPSWAKRLFASLQKRKRLGDLAFFSFEWYPFDDVCKSVAPQLARSAGLLASALQRLRDDGLPDNVPAFITEYGYSPYGGRPEVSIEGALLNAEVVGEFLTMGGARAYLYGYEPNELLNEKRCTWGNNMLFGMAASGRIAYRTATFRAAKLISEEWVQGGGRHEVLRASPGTPLLSSYAVRRPDGSVALMLINKDPANAMRVRMLQFRGPLRVFQYSRAQYQWKDAGEKGHPVRDLPPAHYTIPVERTITAPAYSLTIVRGQLH